MPLETGNFISDLVVSNPLGTDPKSKGDDHLRLLKKTVQQSFPSITGAMTLTQDEINALPGDIDAITDGFNGTFAGFTGMVAPFPALIPGNDVKGWLPCDGVAVDRTTYADLFTLIGETYGNGDGTTTFNVPDYRGQFMRGQDEATGIDPDAATRTDRGDSTTGDNVGTKQADEFKAHNHDFKAGSGSQSAIKVDTIGSNSFDSVLIQNAGGAESRPVNINVLYYIHL